MVDELFKEHLARGSACAVRGVERDDAQLSERGRGASDQCKDRNCCTRIDSAVVGQLQSNDILHHTRGDKLTKIAEILSQIERRGTVSTDELLPLVYQELRRLAATQTARERPDQKHDATSLVHEAYLRVVEDGQKRSWDCRAHFFVAAAEAMRRILVDNARRKRRPKHGGDLKRVNLEHCGTLAPSNSEDVLALDEALNQLADEAPAKAQLVRLRYFAGLSLEESAATLGVSLATAKRYWAYARAWLYDALSKGSSERSR
jgi:RNA polymerase sigma factor (TIGR02999 family)